MTTPRPVPGATAVSGTQKGSIPGPSLEAGNARLVAAGSCYARRVEKPVQQRSTSYVDGTSSSVDRAAIWNRLRVEAPPPDAGGIAEPPTKTSGPLPGAAAPT